MFSRTSAANPVNVRKSSWTPPFILVVGVASLALLIATDWIRERFVAAENARLHVLVEIQLVASTVHLWLEEYVSGDEVDLTEISNGLQRAELLSSTLIEGGTIIEANIDLPPLPAGSARESAEEVRRHLNTFSMLTNARRAAMQRNEAAGIGSPMDKEYDASYVTFLTSAKQVESLIRRQLADRSRLAHVLFLTILFSWSAIILLAVTVLWSHEREQREVEKKLRKKEAQLAQSQKLDAIGRLAGGITHDINNYVAAINSNCELIKLTNKSDSSIVGKIDNILSVTEKISALIDRLLAFSSKQPRQRKRVDLNSLLASIKPTMRSIAGEKINLVLTLQDDLWPIWMDPRQIERVVMNLTVNASQAMPDGGEIRLSTRNTSMDETDVPKGKAFRARDYVCFTFGDNGPGIPDELQRKVFEPFFTTKKPDKNHGLGLATVYGIVHQNDGFIALHSEPGHGTAFSIFLPRHVKPTERAPASPPAS